MEMQNLRRVGKTWELCAGCLLVVVGIGLIDCAEDLPLELWTMVAMCAGGILACLRGEQRISVVSSPRIIAEQEAACIRYMVHEGLIEELLPQMSKKITEETD